MMHPSVEWENPIIIDMVGDRLQCTQVIPNGEYGYMRKEIASSTRTWTQVNGSHENFNTVYTMEDGAVLSHKKLSEFLDIIMTQYRQSVEEQRIKIENGKNAEGSVTDSCTLFKFYVV